MTTAQHNLYQLSTGGTYRSRFTYASGYTPLPDRKSFVPPMAQERNRKSIEINGFKPGIRISGEGSKWPDFLANGGGYVSFFVSERVIADLQKDGFDYLDATEFPVESIETPTKLRIEDAPRYFVLEAHPELVPDWETMNVPTTADGKPITPFPSTARMSPFIYRKDTWSGRDLISHVGIATRIFCSEKFHLYAQTRRWTNLVMGRIGTHTIRPSSEGA